MSEPTASLAARPTPPEPAPTRSAAPAVEPEAEREAYRSARRLLDRLTNRGIQVTRDGEDLVVEPWPAVEGEDRAALRARKAEILAVLAEPEAQVGARKPEPARQVGAYTAPLPAPAAPKARTRPAPWPAPKVLEPRERGPWWARSDAFPPPPPPPRYVAGPVTRRGVRILYDADEVNLSKEQ